MRNLFFIQIFFAVAISCTNNKTKIIDPNVNHELILDTVTNNKSNIEKGNSNISILKNIVFNQISSLKYSSKHYQFDSLIITDLDSLSKIRIINELYESNIDSIEIFGLFKIRSISEEEYSYLPNHSILILYFNNQNDSKNIFDNHIKTAWEKIDSHHKFEELYFKSGGMSFMLDSNLAVYSFNVCGEGNQNKKVQEIDSLIKDKVFENLTFERFLSSCGSSRWILKD